jgi:hypothetical protein
MRGKTMNRQKALEETIRIWTETKEEKHVYYYCPLCQLRRTNTFGVCTGGLK